MDIIENRYRIIIEPERSGKSISDICTALSFKTNMVQMEETV
jgi:hypothetical protein